MSYSGYLLRIGGSSGTIFPMEYIKVEGYNITPNQRMEAEAKRDVTGVLHRTTVAHTATKIEFNTPMLTNAEVDAMMSLLRSAWSSVAERKLSIYYYDMETDSYNSATVYMPDIKFQIDHIDNENNIVYYKETRIAFIEY